MADPLDAASELAARRLAEYVDLWEHAAARLVDGEYHSEDLLDDWFSWWGKFVRDSTAAAALTWRVAGREQPDTTDGAVTPGAGDERHER